MSRHSRNRVLDGVGLQFSFLILDADPRERTWENQARSQESNKIVGSRGFCHVASLSRRILAAESVGRRSGRVAGTKIGQERDSDLAGNSAFGSTGEFTASTYRPVSESVKPPTWKRLARLSDDPNSAAGCGLAGSSAKGEIQTRFGIPHPSDVRANPVIAACERDVSDTIG